MLSCHDATCLMSESNERALSLKERSSLKFHLMMCRGCRNFNAQMGTLRLMTRSYAKTKDKLPK